MGWAARISMCGPAWLSQPNPTRLLKETEKAEVTTHANAITDPKELEAMVLVCNMRPAYNKEWVRVQLKVEQHAELIARALEASFRNVGGEQKHGTAPRGPRERKVTELLEGMGVNMPVVPK